MDRIKPLIPILILILVMGSLFANMPDSPLRKEPAKSYSDFLKEVNAGNIREVMLDRTNNEVRYVLKDKLARTIVPDDEEFFKILKQKDVNINVKDLPNSFWREWMPQIFVAMLLIVPLLLFLRQAQAGAGQALAFGRSRAKLLKENNPKVTFDDVAGCEEAKEELKEVVEFLKNAQKFKALGAKIPKGVLLLGPPGTGKTLLARAIAGEAGVPFFHISGSDFVEMFVGVGAARVRDLFDQAKKSAPCLVFIDELDAVGRQRGAGLGGGHDEREQTLNQLLVEMDGFDPNQGVILLAATNRPDVLDPALLRPGRFDRHIVVDKPDLKGRRAILDIHVKGKPLDEEMNLDVLARGTPGFSGADLSNLVNEAALLAARRGKSKITMPEMEEAKERVIAGPERKSKLISEKEKEVIAYHESGHALVAKLLPKADPVHKISILPRGLALGYTMQLPVEDRYLMSRSELLEHMAVMLGGRVAEELTFNEVTTGAQNDLERATETARRMVCEYGMSEALGPLTLGRKHEQVFLGRDLFEQRNYSEEVASAIDKEVKRIVENCHAHATTLLTQNQDKLNILAKKLMEKETLEGEGLERVVKEIFGQSEATKEAGEKIPVPEHPPVIKQDKEEKGKLPGPGFLPEPSPS